MELSDDINVKCYPNPFYDEISIKVFLPESSDLSIDILGQDGRLIKQLFLNLPMSQGEHTFKWNGTNSQNKTVASSIYYLRISANKKEQHEIIMLNK